MNLEYKLCNEKKAANCLIYPKEKPNNCDRKDFLNDFYDPNEIFVWSTQTNRTMQTARAKLAGIYSQDDTVLNEILDIEEMCTKFERNLKCFEWCPSSLPQMNLLIQSLSSIIPIHTSETHEEEDFLGMEECYLLVIDWLERLNNQSFWDSLDHRYDNPKYSDLYKTISEYFSIPLKEGSFIAGFVLSDYLISMKHEINISPIIDEELLHSFTMEFIDKVISEEGSKAFASRMIHPLLSLFKGEESIIPQSKVVLISAHDAQLHHFLKALSSPQRVPFSSRITLEVHSDPDTISAFKDDVPIELKACGSHTCELQQFIAYYESHLLTPEESLEVCNSRNGQEPFSKNKDIREAFYSYLRKIGIEF